MYQEVEIEKLSDINPFIVGTWEGLSNPITEDDVLLSINKKDFLDIQYNPESIWSREDHIRRIAYLVFFGWDINEPITIYNHPMGRFLMDGNHRLCASIVKGYKKIKIKNTFLGN